MKGVNALEKLDFVTNSEALPLNSTLPGDTFVLRPEVDTVPGWITADAPESSVMVTD